MILVRHKKYGFVGSATFDEGGSFYSVLLKDGEDIKVKDFGVVSLMDYAPLISWRGTPDRFYSSFEIIKNEQEYDI